MQLELKMKAINKLTNPPSILISTEFVSKWGVKCRVREEYLHRLTSVVAYHRRKCEEKGGGQQL
jgi:hypothetical protein